jgi:hypothetical protein
MQTGRYGKAQNAELKYLNLSLNGIHLIETGALTKNFYGQRM